MLLNVKLFKDILFTHKVIKNKFIFIINSKIQIRCNIFEQKFDFGVGLQYLRVIIVLQLPITINRILFTLFKANLIFTLYLFISFEFNFMIFF